jgi:Gas vesicle protein
VVRRKGPDHSWQQFGSTHRRPETGADAVRRRITPGSSLADVIDTILDMGLVIDIYIRLSLVGIELLTIDGAHRDCQCRHLPAQMRRTPNLSVAFDAEDAPLIKSPGRLDHILGPRVSAAVAAGLPSTRAFRR